MLALMAPGGPSCAICADPNPLVMLHPGAGPLTPNVVKPFPGTKNVFEQTVPPAEVNAVNVTETLKDVLFRICGAAS